MTSTVTLNPLSDFSDRLSPMVVKELRQGLRTRMFALLMLILHGLLILVTLISGVNDRGVDTSWMLQGLSILCLCIIMPLRGFSAVAGEMQRNTLDMLVLTRLSAVRIVFGKWISIVLQSLLVALSLMPYVVASYVYGGTDLVHELLMLGLKWLIGIVIAAAIVCLSTQRHFGLRAAVVGLALLFPAMGSLAFGMAMMFGGSGTMSSSWSVTAAGVMPTVWALFGAAWFIFAFLSLAATRIAPAGSNLAVVKRPVHVAVILVLMIAAWLTKMPGNFLFNAVAFVAWFATLDAMVERENMVPSTLTPFYRRGLLGRLAGWFLAPGWPNGMWYSLALTSAVTAAGLLMAGFDSAVLVWLAVADVWLCATVLHLLFSRRVVDLLAPYIAIALVMFLVKMFALMIVQASADEGALWLSMLFPSTALASLELLKARSVTTTLTFEQLRWLGLGLSCLWPLVLGIIALRALRKTRPLREEARRLATSP
jgi:hypothetical protein